MQPDFSNMTDTWLSTLQAENAQLRAELASLQATCEDLCKEVGRHQERLIDLLTDAKTAVEAIELAIGAVHGLLIVAIAKAEGRA